MGTRDNAHFKQREKQTRTSLIPGRPAIVRLDGRAFHSYCRGLGRPFDERFMADMDATMVALAEQVDGVRLAYVQSDEISLLLTDHRIRDDGTVSEQCFMFSGGVQKLVSITAAIASTTLNIRRLGDVTDRVALFDSRAFSVDSLEEARAYFAWRQDDARRNSLSMLAETHFSHHELLGVHSGGRASMLRERGIEPDDLPEGFRAGRIVTYRQQPGISTFFDKRAGENRTIEFTRTVASAAAAPEFTSHDAFVAALR